MRLKISKSAIFRLCFNMLTLWDGEGWAYFAIFFWSRHYFMSFMQSSGNSMHMNHLGPRTVHIFRLIPFLMEG